MIIINDPPTSEAVKLAVELAMKRLENGEFSRKNIHDDAYEKVVHFQNIYFKVIQDILDIEGVQINVKKDNFKNGFFRRSFMRKISEGQTQKIIDIISKIS